ncbi:MAG: sigma-70 family RNA polymerase sigma factor [Ruminococcus sp.]|nr:sigma-70 family RNA polymerase sigma factor [Ruminococcus sp.]
MEKKILKVYDTITGKMVDVEVTPEVYEAYMRTEWNIHDNNESFYKHEIQFSQLVGGSEGAYENFDEFIQDDDYEDDIINKIYMDKLPGALKKLSKHERELIDLLFYQNMSEDECAEELSISRQNVHNKKMRILSKLNKLLKNE